MKELTVSQAKRFGIYSCREGDKLKAVARIMADRNISTLVVVDDTGALRGVITRTDLVQACHREPNWASLTVGSYMNADVVTVELNQPLADVVELLIDHNIHRVVAVRHEGHRQIPVGVLSAADVVYHMARE